MNKETKRKRRENFKYDEKIDIVKKHYFEGASLKELARIYNTESSVITRILSNFAKDIARLEKMYKKYGIKNTKSIIYEGMRHEILNENEKQKVYEDVVSFLKADIEKKNVI